jgi:hypothetical protein
MANSNALSLLSLRNRQRNGNSFRDLKERDLINYGKSAKKELASLTMQRIRNQNF